MSPYGGQAFRESWIQTISCLTQLPRLIFRPAFSLSVDNEWTSTPFREGCVEDSIS